MEEQKMFQKNVIIGGQALTLTSNVSYEHMDEVAFFVDQKLADIRLNKKISTNLLAGIVLGIEITDEYFVQKKEFENEMKVLIEEHENEVSQLRKEAINKEKELVKYIEKTTIIDDEKELDEQKLQSAYEELEALKEENVSLYEKAYNNASDSEHELMEQIKTLKETVEKLQKENERVTEISDTNTKLIIQKEEENQNIIGKLESLEKENKYLLEQQITEIEKIKNEKDEIESEFKTNKEEMNLALETAINENNELKNKIKEIENDNDTILKGAIDELEIVREQSLKKAELLTIIEKENKELTEIIGKLEQEKQEKQSQNDDKVALTKDEHEIIKADMEKQISELLKTLEEKDAETIKLKQSISYIEDDSTTTLKKAVDELEKAVNDKNKLEADFVKEKELLEMAIKQTVMENELLRKELRRTEEDNNDILKGSIEELEEAKEKEKEINEELLQSKKECKQLNDELIATKNELEAIKDANKSFVDSLSDDKNLSDDDKKLHDVLNELNILKAENLSFTQSVENEKLELETQKLKLEKEKKDLQSKITNLEKENVTLKEDLEVAKYDNTLDEDKELDKIYYDFVEQEVESLNKLDKDENVDSENKDKVLRHKLRRKKGKR